MHDQGYHKFLCAGSSGPQLANEHPRHLPDNEGPGQPALGLQAVGAGFSPQSFYHPGYLQYSGQSCA